MNSSFSKKSKYHNLYINVYIPFLDPIVITVSLHRNGCQCVVYSSASWSCIITQVPIWSILIYLRWRWWRRNIWFHHYHHLHFHHSDSFSRFTILSRFFIVKLQPKFLVKKRLGADFVFTLSQWRWRWGSQPH